MKKTTDSTQLRRTRFHLKGAMAILLALVIGLSLSLTAFAQEAHPGEPEVPDTTQSPENNLTGLLFILCSFLPIVGPLIFVAISGGSVPAYDAGFILASVFPVVGPAIYLAAREAKQAA